MNRVLSLLLACLILVCSAPTQGEELTQSKKADIQKLLTVINIGRMAERWGMLTMQGLRQSLRTCTNCTHQTFDVIERETLALFREQSARPEGLTERMLMIYHKHFSHSEIRQLIALYETPIGKRLLVETPLIGEEGLLAAQEWGQSLGPTLDKRIKTALIREKLPLPALPASSAAK